MFRLIITDHANRRLRERVSFLSAEDYMSVALDAFSRHDCRPISDSSLCVYLNHLERESYPGERRFVSVWGDYVFVFSKTKMRNDHRIFLQTVYRINRETILNCAIYEAFKYSRY
jgi:hypothetical protein